MPTIDSITTIDGGYTYTFSAGNVDIWLDGTLLEEAYADTEYTIYTKATTPPPIEIVTHGSRCTNSWASRRMAIQFFADTFTAFAVSEYRSGVLYSTDYYDVPLPERYVTVYVDMLATDATTQYWTVRPAVKYNKGEYSISGMPVQVVTRRHYLPKPPNVTYSYNAVTRILTIS